MITLIFFFFFLANGIFNENNTKGDDGKLQVCKSAIRAACQDPQDGQI